MIHVSLLHNLQHSWLYNHTCILNKQIIGLIQKRRCQSLSWKLFDLFTLPEWKCFKELSADKKKFGFFSNHGETIVILWPSLQNRLNVVQMVKKCQCYRLLITIGMMWITFECMLFMCTYCFWSRFVCICYLYTTHPMINVIAWQSIEISCLNRSKMSIYLDLLLWRVELGTDSLAMHLIQRLHSMNSMENWKQHNFVRLIV